MWLQTCKWASCRILFGFGHYGIIPCVRIMAVIPPNPSWWSGSAGPLRQMVVIGRRSLQSECLEDPVWTAVWGIPPADRHSWRSRSVWVTRTQPRLCQARESRVGLSRAESSDPFRRPSADWVLSSVKWSGVCPEGSMLMGVCSAL